MNMFNNVAQNLKDRFESPTGRATANLLRQNMVKRMHWITGKMIEATQVRQISATQFSVVVGVFYAELENSRRGSKPPPRKGGGTGPHKFAEPAMNETIDTKLDDIANALMLFINSG